MGIEPTTAGTTTRGSTTELRPPSTPTAAPVYSVARPAGLEPATYGLEGRCSIQLSYGRTVLDTSVSQCTRVFPSFRLVGAAGFEPATLCSQSRCATRLRHAPTCRNAGARIIRGSSQARQTFAIDGLARSAVAPLGNSTRLVIEQHACRRQLVANFIGSLEILRRSRGLAFSNQRVDGRLRQRD